MVQIAVRLGDRFRLLRHTGKIVGDRARTLECAVTWSYDLLSSAERRLFDRLSVFAGSFSLAAAECVGADTPDLPSTPSGAEARASEDVAVRTMSPPPVSPAAEALSKGDVLDLMSALVDKSMITIVPGDADGLRYELLQTLRAFGRPRLEGSGDAERVRARHAAFYLQLVQGTNVTSTRAGADDLPNRILFDHANLREALAWSRRCDPAVWSALCTALDPFPRLRCCLGTTDAALITPCPSCPLK